jgi:hypothetical protein
MTGLRDLARMVSQTSGTGSMVMVRTAEGYKSFDDANVQEGVPVSYAGWWNDQRETGRGTWTSSTQTLSRDDVHSSTNGDAALDILGESQWAVMAIAQDFADLEGQGGGTILGTFLLTGKLSGPRDFRSSYRRQITTFRASTTRAYSNP